MNYANIKYCDIANGVGVRTSLFVSGCRHHCKDCFNAMAWDFAYGKPFTEEVENQILKSLEPFYIKGLTLLGGEPMEKENQEAVLHLLKRVRAAHPEKSIWVYSGFTLEELLGEVPSHAATPEAKEILALSDVLVDGRFIAEEKDISLQFRGSRNQRIIELRPTLESGEIVWWQDPINV